MGPQSTSNSNPRGRKKQRDNSGNYQSVQPKMNLLNPHRTSTSPMQDGNKGAGGQMSAMIVNSAKMQSNKAAITLS